MYGGCTTGETMVERNRSSPRTRSRLLCVVMFYWIARVWLKLYRGEMNQDPVVYALRDGGSYAAGLSALVIAYIASR